MLLISRIFRAWKSYILRDDVFSDQFSNSPADVSRIMDVNIPANLHVFFCSYNLVSRDADLFALESICCPNSVSVTQLFLYTSCR